MARRNWKDKIMNTFSYDRWVSKQAIKVEMAVRDLAMRGRFDAAVYCLPSNGSEQGELIVATEPPPGMLEVVSFQPYGTRIASVPYSAMHSAIWNVCRRLPICPTA
jgi:hypothetical protein